MNAFLKKYAFEIDPALVEPYYKRAITVREKRGNEVFAFEKYGAFTKMTADIAAIRDKLVSDPDNALYCYLLADALRDENEAVYKPLSSPCKAEESELFDTLPLFALLDLVPDMQAEHKQRGIPAEVTRDTVAAFETQVGDFITLHHRYGISTYVWWMLGFVKCRIVRVGRLNFELATYSSAYDFFEKDGVLLPLAKGRTFHRSGRVLGSVGCTDEEGSFRGELEETETAYTGLPVVDGFGKNTPVTLLKSEWRRVLTQGDTVVSVHIPSSGGALTPEICDRDISRARELFERCFGGFAAFYCGSWLLDPQIKTVLGKETNITRFGDRFCRYPTTNDGKAVFSYVFARPADTPVADLPEDSSMAKAIKAHMLSGGFIYALGGVFL